MPKLMPALLAATAFALPFAAQAAEQYTLDPSHTHVAWHAGHMGFSVPTGIFANITGSLTLDEQNPSASKVEAVIKPAEMVTGIAKFDEHMRGSDFFDVAKFPEATFKSTKVEVTGASTAIVTGDLTIKGVTKPAVLDVKLNKLGENPFSKQKTAGFSATTMIKRSDFGITYGTPHVPDEINLTIESEANVPNVSPAAEIRPAAPAGR